ncbi:MAG: hypothetical protein A4E48_00436 [Methanosaeta sp. PtaU1.Bin060]|nr:MAG: hypothetical protein A4E48_00436 [Methanosaeta sp. PtaU1.Bin060]
MFLRSAKRRAPGAVGEGIWGSRCTPFPGGLLADLEELLGCRVDVVTDAGLHRYIREKVLKEAVSL